MGTISVSLPSDGETADVSDYNTPITTIVNEINGGLDNSNIAANAAIDGSKLANGSVDTDTLAESAVTSPKLVENFFRGRIQANTTNSAPTDLLVQSGWGYVNASSGNSATKVVTFPQAFASIQTLEFGNLGFKTAPAPTAITDFNTAFGESVTPSAGAISNSSFTINLYKTVAYNSNNNLYGFWWRATGTI